MNIFDMFKKDKPSLIDENNFYLLERVFEYWNSKDIYTLTNATVGLYNLMKKNNYNVYYIENRHIIYLNPSTSGKRPKELQVSTENLIQILKDLKRKVDQNNGEKN